MIHNDPQTKNPGDKNSFLNAEMVVTLCCSGTLRASSVAPITHRAQPIQPYHSALAPEVLFAKTYEKGQFLLQEEVREDRTYHYRQRAHGRDQDCLGECAERDQQLVHPNFRARPPHIFTH
jgi:hypothetical protein